MTELATRMSIDEQLIWLFEGTSFADEAELHQLERQFSAEAGIVASLHDKVSAGQADEDDQQRYKSSCREIDRLRQEIDKLKAELRGPEAAETGLRGQMRKELQQKLELSAKLKAKGLSDWPLRIYLGVDPTRESLHIGHMVPCVQLRKFQALGHQVIFLIGDYTATIGDPSGQSSEREQLTHERVLELAKFYTAQAFRLLDEDKTEVRYNGEWLAKLTFAQTAELAAQFSLSRIAARQDFRSRAEAGQEVGLHESLYALMQGYDAFALNCDVQVGGYDQHLNLLAGRTLQKYFAAKYGRDGEHPLYADFPATGKRVKGPHVMLTYPLLMGTDGRKMSKSWGNTIDVLDTPEDMYGKVMRISDEMLANYIDVAIEARQTEKDQWKAKAQDDPMGVKKWVAHRLTELYHGAEAAAQAAEQFRRTVQEKTFSEEDIEDASVPDEFKSSEVRLVDLVVALKLAPSKKEARRLMEQGGVKLNDDPVTDPFAAYTHEPGTVLRVGKRKVVKLM
ncbi:tyrosine--tRNA ligase [bacterium]|nr:tyrosine--tRNA ligase [bacterium]